MGLGVGSMTMFERFGERDCTPGGSPVKLYYVPKQIDDVTAADWPLLKTALMDLVSNVIMHPENEMEWFVAWCRQHSAVIETVALAG
ncbi:MAG: hypothetical protein ACLQRH_13060 [Acidimicrobiales bacterium]